ncbi:MAG: DinB family protein, partial [Planctomycetaceae bacterium]|nr:DinB family protein [Planctomycetaceae bacterium]
MSAADIIRRLHRHRQWVNRQLLAVVQGLSLEQLHTPLAIGQGSVWRTLTHLLAAEFVWLGTLQGDDQARLPGDVTGRLPGNQAGPNAIVSLGELTDRWRSLDQAWDTYLAALDDDTLDQTVYRVSTSSGAGKRWGVRTSDVLLHVCTHAQYTTAQLVNMLRQLAVTPL